MPDANTGTDGRFRVDAPGWRGTAEQQIFLGANDIFILGEGEVPEECRWYRFLVKDDSDDPVVGASIESIDVVIDGSGVALSDATGLFDGAKDDAGSINIYWNSTDSRYEVQNKLAGSAGAYVTFFRIF